MVACLLQVDHLDWSGLVHQNQTLLGKTNVDICDHEHKAHHSYSKVLGDGVLPFLVATDGGMAVKELTGLE